MDYTRASPNLDILVAERLDRRPKKRETALVITTFDNTACLTKHLEILRKQTVRNFDIIIIYGNKDNFVTSFNDMAILHIKEKGRNGCEGAFFIGQKIALDEGYRTCIFADDDCFPHSDNLVEELVKSVEGGSKVAFPYRKAGDLDIRQNLVFHYGCFSSRFLEEIGLTYYPFYFGGGDLELLERIKKAGVKPNRPEVRVLHPAATPPLIDDLTKRYYYVRGGFQAAVLSGNYWKVFLDTNAHILGALCLLLFGKKSRAGVLMRGLYDGVGMKFFKTTINAADDRKIISGERDKDWVVFRPKRTLTLDKVRHYGGLEGIIMLMQLALQSLSIFLEFRKYFGKTVYLEGAVKPSHFPIMLMAKSMYIRKGEQIFEVFSNRGFINRILSMPIIVILSPSVIALSLILIAIGTLNGRGISTLGYGTRF